MSCPPNPPWLNHSNYISQRVQAKKVLIMQFSPSSYYFIISCNLACFPLSDSFEHPSLNHGPCCFSLQ
jgi:hypothetical protein